MTAEREQLLEKIKRVQALAERGVGGERENAAALLERLMKQHGISEADISEVREKLEWFRYKTDLERKLLLQVIYSITGKVAAGCVGTFTNRTRKMLGVECTAAERLEIEISFDFYKNALESELERFYFAFLTKNHIFPPPEKERANPPDREISREELMKLEAMMAGMDEHTRRAMLESGAIL